MNASRLGLLAALAACLWVPGLARGTQETSFDYLYIEANEGGSSGGHAALRVGHHVYHFQNKDGLLVLFREPSNEFLYSYALLSNRTIDVSRVGVSAETEAVVRQQLATRHRAQEAQLDVLDALRQDRVLLDEMLRRTRTGRPADAMPPIDVPGLGYFAPSEASDTQRSPVLVALRNDVARAHGAEFIAHRRESARSELARVVALDPTGWQATPPDSAYQHPAFDLPWSTRIVSAASELAALGVLSRAPLLDRTGVHAPVGDEFRLAAHERAALERYRQTLASQLVSVFRSRRPDWGRVALIGMARLAAFDEALGTDRLVFLDSLPSDGMRLDRSTVKGRGEIMSAMLGETRLELENMRAFLTRADPPSELVWERIEERANRYHELQRAIRDRADVRVARGHLVPARSAPFALDPLLTPPQLELRISRVRDRERRYERALDRLYRYQLITRNCVSALFETLNDGFGDSPPVSAQALGGWVDGRSRLGFIPVVSAAQVDDRFRVIARERIPSYRRMRLDELKRDGGGFLVTLRESNTLTSATYRRAARDSFFVFFTDDAPALRPVFGAINLIGALGETVWGVLKLPIDRGKTFRSGIRGTLVSVPELVFVNIRKGSNDWIAPELRVFEPEPRH